MYDAKTALCMPSINCTQPYTVDSCYMVYVYYLDRESIVRWSWHHNAGCGSQEEDK